MEWYIQYATGVIQIGIGIFFLGIVSVFLPKYWGAPWVTSSSKNIRRMLDLAKLQPGETLIDLGAGDGRIMIMAAKRYDALTKGVELDPIRCVLGKLAIKINKVQDQCELTWGTISNYDFSSADVISIFMTREFNSKYKVDFESNLNVGTRVVSNLFPIQDWEPIIIDEKNLIFLYEIGNINGENPIKFV